MKIKHLILLITVTMLPTVSIAKATEVTVANDNVSTIKKIGPISKNKPTIRQRKVITAKSIPPNFKGIWVTANDNTGRADPNRILPNQPFKIEIHDNPTQRNGFALAWTEKVFQNTTTYAQQSRSLASPAKLIRHPKYGYALEVKRVHQYIGIPRSKDHHIFKESFLLRFNAISRHPKLINVFVKRLSVTRVDHATGRHIPQTLGEREKVYLYSHSLVMK